MYFIAKWKMNFKIENFEIKRVLHLYQPSIHYESNERKLWRPKDFREPWGTSDSKLWKSLTSDWNSDMCKMYFKLLFMSKCSVNYVDAIYLSKCVVLHILSEILMERKLRRNLLFSLFAKRNLLTKQRY